MSQQMGPSCNKKSFFSVAKDELFTSEKLGIFDVVINGFLISQKMLMLQRRSNLMSQKTEYVKDAKVNSFNV